MDNKISLKTVIEDILLSDECERNLETLCDELESRFPGSEGEKKTVTFLSQKLEDYGFNQVKTESFKYIGWSRGKTKLEMLKPFYRNLEAISLVLSPPTLENGIMGEIIYLGMGLPEFFKRKRKKIKDKIVLCSSAQKPSRQIHRRTKYGYAVKYGAKGFIFMNHNQGQLPITGSLRPGSEMSGEIPSVGISKETGEFIIRQIKKGKVTIRMSLKNQVKPESTSWNIVGEIPGTKSSCGFIVFGGHYDCHDISQGAIDNAAGVCIILEVVRLLAQRIGSLKRKIRIIFFGAEEFGLAGSTNYVKMHQKEIPLMELMINCDVAGEGKPVIEVYQPTELLRYLKKLDREIKLNAYPTINLTTSSDHWPFFVNGVPCIGLSQQRDPAKVTMGRGYGHTSADTFDKVNIDLLKESAILLTKLLLRLANKKGSISEQVPLNLIIKRLQKEGFEKNLRVQKKWSSLPSISK